MYVCSTLVELKNKFKNIIAWKTFDNYFEFNDRWTVYQRSLGFKSLFASHPLSLLSVQCVYFAMNAMKMKISYVEPIPPKLKTKQWVMVILFSTLQVLI